MSVSIGWRRLPPNHISYSQETRKSRSCFDSHFVARNIYMSFLDAYASVPLQWQTRSTTIKPHPHPHYITLTLKERFVRIKLIRLRIYIIGFVGNEDYPLSEISGPELSWRFKSEHFLNHIFNNITSSRRSAKCSRLSIINLKYIFLLAFVRLR